ncbi:MAG: transposase [Candidatus Diapherotrites archaeon]
MVDSLKRAIQLQIADLTKSKTNALKEFSQQAVSLANLLLSKRKTKRLMDLHNATYLTSKKNTPFNSQIICDIERTVVICKGKYLRAITVKFNVPRNCKTFETKANYFIRLGMYPRKRFAVPIKQNRNYQRFKSLLENGWICKTYGLTSNLEIVAYLSKEEIELPQRKNILGIDINSKCFAVSVVSPAGKVLKQTYFGKDIWVKRKKIFERKERLQSFADRGSNRAKKSLERLKHREHNFVKNRLGEVVRDITEMAIEYNADIAIENLKRFSPKGKRFNKEVMRIPFYSFKQLLESRCFDKNIMLNVVDAYHTSKWCSHCGAVGKGHSSNYSLFKCKECGQIVNSDRKASLAVAVKSLLERKNQAINHNLFFQFTNRQVPVNGLLRQNDEFVSNSAVHLDSSPIESPLL